MAITTPIVRDGAERLREAVNSLSDEERQLWATELDDPTLIRPQGLRLWLSERAWWRWPRVPLTVDRRSFIKHEPPTAKPIKAQLSKEP